MVVAARCPALLARANLLKIQAAILKTDAFAAPANDPTVLGLVRLFFYRNRAFEVELEAKRYDDLRDHIMRFADRTWKELKGLPVAPDPASPEPCQHERKIGGYGFAAGQLGTYVMCKDCSEILDVEPERERIDPHGRHPCGLELGLDSCKWCYPVKPANQQE